MNETESAVTVRYELSGRSIVWIASVVASVWLLTKLWPVVVILLVALILVGTLNPFAASLQRHGFSRQAAVLLVFATLIVSLGVALLLVIPALGNQISQLLKAAPEVQANLASELSNHTLTRGLARPVRAFEPMDLLAKHGQEAFAYSRSAAVAIGVVGTTLALAFYLLADPLRSLGLLFAIIPRTHHVKMATILSNLENIVGGYMRGQVITSACIGAFVFALLWAFGISTPIPLAAFAALTDVLPFVGGLLALTPAVLAALPKGPHAAFIVFALIVLYQEFESRILVPRIYGKALRLPPAAVVLALLVGGKLMGFVGALIALPVASGLVMLVEELRLEMPGLAVDQGLKKLDDQATRIYEKRSVDATPEEAAEIAAEVASESRDDSEPPK